MEVLALKASLSSPSDSKEYRGMLSEIEDHNFRNRQGVSEQEMVFPDRSADERPQRRGRARVFASHSAEFESGPGIDWSSVSEIERALQPRPGAP